jgi:hypothetical protein
MYRFYLESKIKKTNAPRCLDQMPGRIAMFAFVGYIVHANGIKFPWAMEMDGTPFPTVSSAPEAWDSISDTAKLQIFLFIGFLEFVSSWKRALIKWCFEWSIAHFIFSPLSTVR